jgi:hypothetical protein
MSKRKESSSWILSKRQRVEPVKKQWDLLTYLYLRLDCSFPLVDSIFHCAPRLFLPRLATNMQTEFLRTIRKRMAVWKDNHSNDLGGRSLLAPIPQMDSRADIFRQDQKAADIGHLPFDKYELSWKPSFYYHVRIIMESTLAGSLQITVTDRVALFRDGVPAASWLMDVENRTIRYEVAHEGFTGVHGAVSKRVGLRKLCRKIENDIVGDLEDRIMVPQEVPVQ